MIQDFFKENCEELFPNYSWSVDYFVDKDNSGSVYSEGGSKPSTYEDKLRYPNYMIMLRSSNWEQVEQDSHLVLKTFRDMSQTLYIDSRGKTFEIYFIEPQSEPVRLGVTDNIMEYTINFNCTIREVS